MPKLFLLSSLGSRLPIVASVVAHVALVAAAQGHGNGRSLGPDAPATEALIEVEVAAPVPEPPPVEVHDHDHDHEHTFAPHTHAYPVSADHDAHPHDPAIDHRVAQKASSPAAPSPAASELAAEAPSVMTSSADGNVPTFSIVLGNAGSSGGGISRAGGQGAGRGVAFSPSEDTPLPEAMVTVPARLASSVRPEYPSAARAGGVEADVPLEIVVDAAGNVIETKLLRHAGHGFDESALRAIRSYRFTPARHDNAAVRVRMHWTVSFRLE